MPVSRRKFLQNGALAAATLAGAPLSAWSNASSVANTPFAHIGGKPLTMGRQAFEQAVGSAFSVSSGAKDSAPVWLTLIAVDDLPVIEPVNAGTMAVPPPKTSSSVTTQGFMLLFQSSAPPLAQGSYAFQHAKMGQFPLFIVPVGHGTQTYLAVFNLLTSAGPTPPHPVRH